MHFPFVWPRLCLFVLAEDADLRLERDAGLIKDAGFEEIWIIQDNEFIPVKI